MVNIRVSKNKKTSGIEPLTRNNIKPVMEVWNDIPNENPTNNINAANTSF